ncbi:hypothetical protein KY284_021735 [Solanum tuberosum]|nr:hypothetical protein KY284_021735 [Solanum tuberosum]
MAATGIFTLAYLLLTGWPCRSDSLKWMAKNDGIFSVKSSKAAQEGVNEALEADISKNNGWIWMDSTQ